VASRMGVGEDWRFAIRDLLGEHAAHQEGEKMSDVKLFRITNGSAEELLGRAVKLERKLQTLIETHLETFLHVRFVASEYSTGKTHAGRIDTLGLDENFCPTIIEYKRNSNANVINQGLPYQSPSQRSKNSGLSPRR
jgi:hypothetical protein